LVKRPNTAVLPKFPHSTVPKEFQIGLHNPAEADVKYF